MELKDYILGELNGQKRGLSRTLNELTQAEFLWRPTCGCNSIGLILFHVARSEDHFVQDVLRQKPQEWEAGKWFLKLNMAENESGARYTFEQVNAFAVPEAKNLVAYFEAVRAKTLQYVSELKTPDFDRKFSMPPFGEMTVAGMLSLIVSHSSGHFGEMSYVRGVQRGMDK